MEDLNRMGTCHTCDANIGKYRCPGCMTVSCSKDCVAEHKKARKCDGVRNKSKFISLNEFGELDLLSDYRFLESADRCIESITRDKLKHFTRQGERAMTLPPHLAQLRKACSIRGCRIRFLPPHFDRHRTNSSKLDFKSREISWKVQLVFVHCQQIVIMEKVHERTKLCDILSPYMEDIDAFGGQMRKRRKVSDGDDDSWEDPFLVYKSKGFGGVRLLLKAEGIHTKPRSFYPIEADKSLAWNLKGKILVENPIIYVVFSDHASYFINDSDSEEDEQGETLKENGTKTVPDRVQRIESNPDSRRIDNYPTMMFANPSAPPLPSGNADNNETYSKYYEYYFKYYVNKFGVTPDSSIAHPANMVSQNAMSNSSLSNPSTSGSVAISKVLAPTPTSQKSAIVKPQHSTPETIPSKPEIGKMPTPTTKQDPPKPSSSLFLVAYSGSEDEADE